MELKIKNMIQKRSKYFQVEDVTVVNYGHGTILMTPAESMQDAGKILLLKSHEARPIGSTQKNTYFENNTKTISTGFCKRHIKKEL